MQITKEYCDRCGKEIKTGSGRRLYPIVTLKPKSYIRFREEIDYTETNHMVCADCLNQFKAWWKQGLVSEKKSEMFEGEYK